MMENEKRYINNWVNPSKLNLTCEDDAIIGLIGSVYFAGFAISSGIVPPISDILGRKWIFIACLTVQTACYSVIIMTTDIHHIIYSNFVIGLCSGGFMTMIVYLNEFLMADL